MPSEHPPTEMLQLETGWLQRYAWLLSFLGFGLGIGISHGLWAAILLDASFLPHAPLEWLSLKGLCLGLAFASFPWLWRLGIWVEQQPRLALRQWPAAPLLAMAGILCLHAGLETPIGQSIFWQTVRARAGDRHDARELSLLREDAAASPNAPPGIVLMGSSQVVHAFDVARIGNHIHRPVYRRAVAGLFIAELVASQQFSDFNPRNRLILMMSGFDLGARYDLNPDILRPLSTPSGLRHVRTAASWPFFIRRWRVFADISFASICDLWRSRDYARLVLQNPFSVKPSDSPASEAPALEAQAKAYHELGSNPEMVALCLQALAGFLSEMSSRTAEIIVLEGRVNPDYRTKELTVLSQQLRKFLLAQQQLGHIRYVSLDEQNLDIPDSAWKDMTHVNSAGRELFTDMLIRLLQPDQGLASTATPVTAW